eukprot:TRINITY_DN47216_c0_g1_i1.p2 TRINITY_DN47216_c0_g1~~TRINITY_DN47216_c0_g1_i1.p2  ORF type:complete len:442 (+),score=129.36 TRINITY_DN47216_c0_g1_i1:34-1326(+)
MAVRTDKAPKPVGAYPHARVYGDLLFVSGMGPRGLDDSIPGGPVWDSEGRKREYDVYAQTKATVENIKRVLEASGAAFGDIIDVQCFLINMERDFKDFNRAYKECFAGHAPTRTTVAVRALPTPIAVELKVIARAPGSTITPKTVTVNGAPVPVGAYPHAKIYGDLLFVSGMGPRDPVTNEVPGGPIYDKDRKPLEYDVYKQTKATINNIRNVIAAAGGRFEDILDVNCFLVDMKRDFSEFNRAYKEEIGDISATRTTFSVRNLPTPIGVELKVICRAPGSTIKPEEASIVRTEGAPKPVGAYPHARRFGNLLFISGMGPRDPKTNQVPGGPIYDEARRPLEYDVAAQTQSTIDNIKTVLASCGASLTDVVDIQCYLVNMKRDFKAFNEVYRRNFEGVNCTRTTMAIRNLPTPIGVEMKCIARAPVRAKL